MFDEKSGGTHDPLPDGGGSACPACKCGEAGHAAHETDGEEDEEDGKKEVKKVKRAPPNVFKYSRDLEVRQRCRLNTSSP